MDIAVTQGTSTTTAVTANGEVGLITCFTSTLAAAAAITFTVNKGRRNWYKIMLLVLAEIKMPTFFYLLKRGDYQDPFCQSWLLEILI